MNRNDDYFIEIGMVSQMGGEPERKVTVMNRSKNIIHSVHYIAPGSPIHIDLTVLDLTITQGV